MTRRGEQEAAAGQVGVPKDWPEPPREPEKVTEAEAPEWRAAVERLRRVAMRDGLSMADVARGSDVPAGTLSQWLRGIYPGVVANQNLRILRWLDQYEEGRTLDAQIRPEPGYIATPTAEEVVKTLFLAQKLPDMVLVTLGSGMGKTMTARHYAAHRPNTFLVTMRPTTGSISSMLNDIGDTLDITDRNPVARDRAIGAKLRRNGRETLLIVDEAQNLVDKAVDQLRYYLDQYGCGIALLGNNELYSRFGKGEPKEGYGQIHRRTGKRLVRLKPLDADIAALIAAWGVEDEAVAKVLRAIGRKPGSLGQIAKTMRLAGILAALDGKPLALGHVRAAWENRGGEEAH